MSPECPLALSWLAGETARNQGRKATLMNDEKWTELQQAENMACFKADLFCYSPESYTPEEKAAICDDMISTSKAILDACAPISSNYPPVPGASPSTCSASRKSRASSDGGTSSSARATRCTRSLSRWPKPGSKVAFGKGRMRVGNAAFPPSRTFVTERGSSKPSPSRVRPCCAPDGEARPPRTRPRRC